MPTPVQTFISSSQSVACTGITAGNTLVVTAGAFSINTPAITGISDNRSQSYTIADAVVSNSILAGAGGFKLNTVGGSITVSFATTGTPISGTGIIVREYNASD